ncbi:MAG TPA: amidohydrolase family protein [Woeseiaceae bacterium]|nr:amidohydrolase family protein [Woeseiaceae bacterium]
MYKKIIGTVLLLALASVSAAETLVVTADRMFDAESGRISGPVRVVVVDGMIAAVNPDSVPVAAHVVELGDRTLMPGLLDMHTHLTGDYFSGDHWVTMPVYETAADWAVLGTRFALDTLLAGFTTVRDVGSLPGFPDVALMKAVNRGTVPGPDIWPAGHYISITGGHCDITGFAPGIHELGPKQGIADGVDEVIKAVRYQAKHGVKVIKVCATGGVFSFSNNAPVGAQQYSQEELDVIVREASKLGLKVVAHAHGTEGINAAVKAGVASIDHGSVLSDESVRLMKQRGTYLVPQAYISDIPLPPDTPPATVAKNDYLNPLANRSIRKAYEAGVKMALGTDAGVYRHGDNGREFAALVARDLPEEHVLKMATVYAADLLGVDDRGVIAEGKRADLIAVPGNPLEDISVMEDVRFVMKTGVIYKQE